MPRRDLAAVWIIFQKEVTDLIRDRRAVFFAFVLPLALYPFLYLAFSTVGRRDIESKPLRVGLVGARPEFLPYLEEERLTGQAVAPEPERVRKGELALLLSFDITCLDGRNEPGLRREEATVEYLATSRDSQEALLRMRRALERYKASLVKERFKAMKSDFDPDLVVVHEATDISTPQETGLARLGRFLPILLVILLFSGGSFVAIDLVAGEKERGTLETLYIHPVPTRSIVWGKFLVLLCASFVSVLLNFIGIFLSLGLGALLGVAPRGLENLVLSVPSLPVLGAIFVVSLPLAIFSSAVLLVISALARSFREAQTYLLPVTLVALTLVFLAVSPQAKLESVIAVVPVSNAALAIREGLEGKLELFPFALAFVASSAYAALVLRKASRLLQKDEIVLNLEPPVLARDISAEGRAKRGLAFGLLMLLFLYFAASWIQAKYKHIGLAVTLWGFVALPALLYPLLVKVPVRETLGIRGTHRVNFLLVFPIVLSLAVLLTAYMVLQDVFLHMPEKLLESFKDLFDVGGLHPVLALFLLAISPGICEELLWRGTFQGELEPRRRPVSTTLTVALFFGLCHLNVYRLIPTAALGGILATVRHRTGSIFPCMLIHATYNAAIFLLYQLGTRGELGEFEKAMVQPLPVVASVVVLTFSLVCLRNDRPRP